MSSVVTARDGVTRVAIGEEIGVVNSAVVGESAPVLSDAFDGVEGASVVSIALNGLFVDLTGVATAENTVFTGVCVIDVTPPRIGVLGTD